MKKFFAIFLFLVSYSTLSASEHSLNPLLGFRQGNISFGADYEFRFSERVGFGGQFYLGTDDDKNAVAGLMSFGANVKIHFPVSTFDFYVGPGFGLTNVDMPGNDESLLGPTLKLGALYKLSSTVAVGLEYMGIYNWSSDDVKISSIDLAHAVVGIHF